MCIQHYLQLCNVQHNSGVIFQTEFHQNHQNRVKLQQICQTFERLIYFRNHIYFLISPGVSVAKINCIFGFYVYICKSNALNNVNPLIICRLLYYILWVRSCFTMDYILALLMFYSIKMLILHWIFFVHFNFNNFVSNL